jgi:hypothetical protein
LVDELAGVTSKDKRSNPFSLDAINFLLADVRGVLGHFLNVFLISCLLRQLKTHGSVN